MGDLTKDEVMEVPCIICNAKKGECCTNIPGQGRSAPYLIGFHRERTELRKRYPSPVFPSDMPKDLDATDKAIIIYYGFIMLSDAVAANSMKVLGKEMSSQDVQRFFAAQAVKALRKADLLKK